MKMTIPSVKGARDFYPSDMFARNWLYTAIRKVSTGFGYEEYDGPFLEKLELYASKSGEELVKEQSFVFSDRGGDLITLRPELTLSLARMVAAQQNALTFPLRWWSFGPFWRYERPQRGRSREFFQWNIDLVGANSPEIDAELIAVAATLFQEVGLTKDQVVIFINDRRLMESVFHELEIRSDRHADFLRLLDRREKMSAPDWIQYGIEQGYTARQMDQLMNALNDPLLWQKSAELRRVMAAIEAFGVSEFVKYNAAIVRGLDYYTGTVWEAKEKLQTGRSILGGGRYDNLVAAVGGDPLPGSGFAMGDVMFSTILREKGLLPDHPPASVDILVTVFDSNGSIEAIRLATELRLAGLCAAVYPEATKLNKQLKYADRIGAKLVAIAGPDEIASSTVTIKDLARREQRVIPRENFATTIKGMLDHPSGS